MCHRHQILALALLLPFAPADLLQCIIATFQQELLPRVELFATGQDNCYTMCDGATNPRVREKRKVGGFLRHQGDDLPGAVHEENVVQHSGLQLCSESGHP